MRTKVTLVLLFLNVVLFFFIFTFVRKWQTEKIWEQSQRRVLGPEAAVIQSLTITGGRLAQPVELEKRAEGWVLTKPYEWPANPHAVSRILNELLFLENESSFLVKDLAKSGLSLADYGLQKPQMTVAFAAGPRSSTAANEGSSGALKHYTLRIGDTTKVGNRLYVLSPDGKRVDVVNRSLADSLAVSLDQLRTNAIFDIPLFEVRSFNLQTAPANLRIRLRRQGPRWSFEAPILTRADRAKVEMAINGLDALRTGKFLDADSLTPDQTGLNNPNFQLTLDGNGRRETLLLGNPVPQAAPAQTAKPAAGAAVSSTEYYAKMEDRTPIFTVALPNDLATMLRNAQDQLRDRHLLSFDPRALTSITLSAPNRPEITLQRLEVGQQPTDNDAWQIVTRTANQAPQTMPADLKIVQRLIQHLYTLQALQFLRDAPQASELEDWGFNRPQREVTLHFSSKDAFASGAYPTSNPSSVTLLIGVASERAGRAYAKLASEPFVYLVDPDILEQTPVTVTYYRDRLLRELPEGARITGLTLTDIAGKKELLNEQLSGDQTWTQALTALPADRRTAVLTILGQLRKLRAKEFILDTFPPTVEIGDRDRAWRYKLTATLSLVGGSETQTAPYTLFFTERTGGGTQFVGSPDPGLNVVFEADQKLLDALFKLTYGPHDPGPPSAEDFAEPATAPATAH